MCDAFTFVVHGVPIPQGSTRAFIPKGWNRPVITAANSKTKPWRQEIAGCALAEMERLGLSKIGRKTAVKISAYFSFPRPTSVSPKRFPEKTTKPDLDKLVRALLDALTGVVFEDDSQVVMFAAKKGFGAPGLRVRVAEVVEDLPPSIPYERALIVDEECPF